MDKKDQKKKAGQDWAEMSDGEEEEEQQEQTQNVEKDKKKVPAAKKGFKNDRGDYVVTTIDLPDMVPKKNDGEQKDEVTDSDTEYDDEDDVKE